jgi:polyhydroxyalkanoate synthesis regulator phasin
MSLIKALMEGQDLTKEEAKSLILEMRKRIHNDNEDPEEVLYEEGLEPDYVFELI